MEENTIHPECCPKFDTEPWDNKLIDWDNKLFLFDKVFTLFFMPVNFGAVMRRIMKKADVAGAQIPDYLCLSDHTSKWNMDIYLAVDKDLPGAQMRNISGKFLSKVYEGNFNKTGEWCNHYETEAKSRGYEVKKWYMWYTTCPKCAKKYGKNYVVIIGQVE